MTTSIEQFKCQIEELNNDENVINYFLSENKNIYEFIKFYIQVDKLFSNSVHCSNNTTFYDKLDDIKTAINNNSYQLNTIQSNFTHSYTMLMELIQNKIDTISSNIKDVANTDIKQMFFELQKQVSEGLDNQKLKDLLENFKDKFEIINSQKLNDIDRKTLDALSNLQNGLLQSLDSHSITDKINKIETNLSVINEHFSSNSSKKGQLAEGVLMNLLSDTFPDTEVLETSHSANSGDFHLIKSDKPLVLIDSKHFSSKTVPKRDLDKFYSDIQTNNCSGILCNAFGGIANKQHFEIDIVDKNIIVFLHSHKYDPTVFQLAVNIIYNIHEQIKDKHNDSINIDQRLYQNLKIEYNYYLQSFRHHLEIIKTNVNSLSQLSFNLLDNFFKRKASTIELKSFMCHLCGTGCKTDKILKTHIKKIHGIANTNQKKNIDITLVKKEIHSLANVSLSKSSTYSATPQNIINSSDDESNSESL